MSTPLSISELEATATRIRAGGFELRYWRNGSYLVQWPGGESTEVPEEAVAGVLAELFRKFF
jgi:hypothetical protein